MPVRCSPTRAARWPCSWDIPRSRYCRQADYDDQVGLSGEVLTQLRNQAIHMYLCIPQSIVQSAVALARTNPGEFEANWVPRSKSWLELEGQEIGRLPWDQVCASCGLDFLPLALCPSRAYG